MALRIRNARKEDVPALIQFSARAFKGRPMNEALFPKHLQSPGTNADDVISEDELEYRTKRQISKISQENLHCLAVVDDQDSPVGYAVWQDPISTKPKESEAKQAEMKAALPKGMDMAVVDEIEKGSAVLDTHLQDALGEDGYRDSWYLELLVVDPAHQRKGVGKMLMQWGQERADKDHKNVRLMASEVGSMLYRSLGFEEVGSLDLRGGMEYAFVKRAV